MNTRWHPNTVPVRTEGEFPHLGVLLCPKGTFDAQFEKTMAMVKQECSTISSRRCCPATKIAALRIRTTPRALYAPSFCNWPLARYTQLQVPLNKAFKTSARLMQSHPNHLLYTTVPSGGLGLTALSDLCQTTKAGHLHRSLQADPDTAHAANAILARAVRLSDYTPTLYESATIHPTLPGGPPRWTDSYTSHLALAGISIHKGGYEPTTTLDIRIPAVYKAAKHHLFDNEIHKFYTLGIQTLSDISAYYQSTNTWKLTTLALSIAPGLERYEYPTNLTYTYLLRPGLCYTTAGTFPHRPSKS